VPPRRVSSAPPQRQPRLPHRRHLPRHLVRLSSAQLPRQRLRQRVCSADRQPRRHPLLRQHQRRQLVQLSSAPLRRQRPRRRQPRRVPLLQVFSAHPRRPPPLPRQPLPRHRRRLLHPRLVEISSAEPRQRRRQRPVPPRRVSSAPPQRQPRLPHRRHLPRHLVRLSSAHLRPQPRQSLVLLRPPHLYPPHLDHRQEIHRLPRLQRRH